MKQKVNQLFKDKLILVMLVLGLLTIVSAAGVMTIRRGSAEESPYLNMEGEPDHLAEGQGKEEKPAGNSQAERSSPGEGTEEKIMAQGSDQTEKTLAEEGTGSVEREIADGAKEAEAAPAGAGQEEAVSLALNFGQTQSMMWPVEGNVILDYSMDSTIYFPTLEQYKCNPALVIQSDVSQPVSAPADSRVIASGTNEEIGNYLVLDLGDGYTVTCGQMKEIQAVEGEYLEKGQVLGYVAEPTKYYTVEGPNLYLQLNRDQSALDPLDYLE